MHEALQGAQARSQVGALALGRGWAGRVKKDALALGWGVARLGEQGAGHEVSDFDAQRRADGQRCGAGRFGGQVLQLQAGMAAGKGGQVDQGAQGLFTRQGCGVDRVQVGVENGCRGRGGGGGLDQPGIGAAGVLHPLAQVAHGGREVGVIAAGLTEQDGPTRQLGVTGVLHQGAQVLQDGCWWRGVLFRAGKDLCQGVQLDREDEEKTVSHLRVKIPGAKGLQGVGLWAEAGGPGQRQGVEPTGAQQGAWAGIGGGVRQDAVMGVKAAVDRGGVRQLQSGGQVVVLPSQLVGPLGAEVLQLTQSLHDQNAEGLKPPASVMRVGDDALEKT